jgi:hypothetical protein
LEGDAVKRRFYGPALASLLVIVALLPAAVVAWPGQGRLHDAIGALGAGAEAAPTTADASNAAEELVAIRARFGDALADAGASAAAAVSPEDSRLARLLSVEQAAESAHVRVRSAKELAPLAADGGGCSLGGLEVAVEGTFAGLVDFLARLESGTRRTTAEKVVLRREGDDAPHVVLTATLRFPFRSSTVIAGPRLDADPDGEDR